MKKRKRSKKQQYAPEPTLRQLLDRAPDRLKSLVLRLDDLCKGEHSIDVMLALTMQLGATIWNHNPPPDGDFDRLQRVLKGVAETMLTHYSTDQVSQTELNKTRQSLMLGPTDGRIH